MNSEQYLKQLQSTTLRTGGLPVLRGQVRQSRERLDLSARGAQVPAVEDDEGGSEPDNSKISANPEQSFALVNPAQGAGLT